MATTSPDANAAEAGLIGGWQGHPGLLDRYITGWLAAHGIGCLRISLGLVFLWFGAVKLVPGWSPASDLAGNTISVVTGGTVPPAVGVPALAVVEAAIGVALLARTLLRATLLILFLQLLGTMLPLVLFPDVTFQRFPFALTLEGQYIIKNLVLLGAAMVVGATVAGGRLVPGGADAGREPKRTPTPRH